MGLNYKQIPTNTDLQRALAQINMNFQQIAAENQTKVIEQNGGTALTWGKLQNGAFGIVLNDQNNIPRILIGFSSKGQPVIAVTKSSRNVIDALARVNKITNPIIEL